MTAAELEQIKLALKNGDIRPEDIGAGLDDVQDAIIETQRQLPSTTEIIDGVRVTVFEPPK